MTTIAILGDYDPNMPTHRALDEARAHAAAALDAKLAFEWVATDALDLAALGTRYHGLWVAPGSPYRDEPRVIRALRRARESGLPTFGNCGGFQFMVLEYARNAAGLKSAWHEESQSGDEPALIAKLACSLKGLQEPLSVRDGTLAARISGAGALTGRFFCSYGVNERYVDRLAAAGLVWSSVNAEGQPRSLEVPGHPFYVGSLFQPALDSAAGRPNPLIVAFLRQVAGYEYRTFTERTPDFVALTEALDRELWAQNGDAQRAYDGFNRLDGIDNGVVAYACGVPVACASYKEHEPGVAEVKRVFVEAAHRGQGVSRALMDALERHARSRGVRRFVLETSRRFDAAVGLYTGLGYQLIPNYPPYTDMPDSVCFAKDLVTRSRPPFRIETERLVLRCWSPEDAALLKAAVDANLDHLRPWMTWAHAEPTPLAEMARRLQGFRDSFERGDEFGFGIFDRQESRVLGACGLHRRAGPEMLELGYWLVQTAVGKGFAQEASRALIEAAWTLPDVDRVEIHHDPKNVRSEQVPVALGFTFESLRRRDFRLADGTLRDSKVWVLYRG